MTTLGWRAWYADGTVYTSSTTSWAALPDDGVVVVMVYFEDGIRRICQGNDYYFDVGNSIAHNDDDPAVTQERYPEASIKRGMWTSDDDYAALVAVAMASTWE